MLKNDQNYLKNPAGFTPQILYDVCPFFNIIHERVKIRLTFPSQFDY